MLSGALVVVCPFPLLLHVSLIRSIVYLFLFTSSFAQYLYYWYIVYCLTLGKKDL
jgi:hypothetical protein